MADNRLLSDLARQAASRAATALLHGNESASQNVAPGDVLVLPATSAQPVQWIVLARDPAQPGRRLVISADANQLVGTADLEVGDDALGPLVIRRPFGGWLNAELLSPGFHVGTLRLDRLAGARNHWFDETNKKSVTGQEVDEDPEYLHWRHSVLKPAYRGLFEEEAKSKRTRWSTAAVAATILLTLGGTFTLWQSRYIDHLHQRLVQTRIASGTLLSPVLQPLEARGQGRGDPVEISVGQEASHVVLILQVSEGPEPSSFNITLKERGSDTLVWQNNNLRADGLGQIWIGLPLELLKSDSYDLSVFRLHGETTEPVPTIELDLLRVDP